MMIKIKQDIHNRKKNKIHGTSVVIHKLAIN